MSKFKIVVLNKTSQVIFTSNKRLRILLKQSKLEFILSNIAAIINTDTIYHRLFQLRPVCENWNGLNESEQQVSDSLFVQKVRLVCF